MKRYTQEEFDKLEVIDGIRQCPSGDYTEIKNFGECCSFGEGCTVESGKVFKQMYTVGGIGSEKRTTYFFLLEDSSIFVRCGCFAGSLEEFENKVKETHDGNEYGRQYAAAVEYIKAVTKETEAEDEK